MDFFFTLKNSKSFPSILILLRHLFSERFPERTSSEDSIQMSNITKRNLNVHFILGNTGHA